MASRRSKRFSRCSGCNEAKPKLTYVEGKLHCTECLAEMTKGDFAVSEIKLEIGEIDTTIQSGDEYKQSIKQDHSILETTARDKTTASGGMLSSVEIKEEYGSDIDDFEFQYEINDTDELSLSNDSDVVHYEDHDHAMGESGTGTTLDANGSQHFENVQIKNEITIEETRVNIEDEYGNDKHRCDPCGLSFGTNVELICHTEEHHPCGNIFYCAICAFATRKPSALKEHFQNRHTGYDSMCKICHEPYHSKESEVHQNQCLGRLLFQCKSCSEYYGKKEALLNHLEGHGIGRVNHDLSFVEVRIMRQFYCCLLCEDGKAYEKDQYWEHIDNVHQGHHLRCTYCPKTFQTKSDQFDHRKEKCTVQMADGKFKCPECLKIFDVKKNLRRHIVLVHRNSRKYSRSAVKKELRCPVCNILSQNRKSLNYHMYHQHQPATCDICKKDFQTKEGYRYHWSKHHSQLSSIVKGQYGCPNCPKILASEKGLHVHTLKLHPSEYENQETTRLAESVQCPYCPLKFSFPVLYQRHLKCHSSEDKDLPAQPNKTIVDCNICGFVCPSNQLSKHLQGNHDGFEFMCRACHGLYRTGESETHRTQCLGRLMFQCKSCLEYYGSRTGLWNHLDDHGISEESKEISVAECQIMRPFYSCSICGDEKAYENDRYWEHVKNVHRGHHLRCKRCSETFATKEALYDHTENADQCKVGPKSDLTCPKCSKSYKNKKSLAYHLRYQHKTVTCDLCKIDFTSILQYRYHKKVKHNKLLSDYIPENSEVEAELKKVANRKNKRDAVRAKNVTKTVCKASKSGNCGCKLRNDDDCAEPIKKAVFKCSECLKVFNCKDSLRVHIAYQHKPATCEICGIDFQTYWLYRYHKKKKHCQLLQCPFCPKKFDRNYRYRNHLMKHRNGRQNLNGSTGETQLNQQL